MDFLRLEPHPNAESAPAIEVEAIALVLPTDALSFRYRVRGDLASLLLPGKGPAHRADQLWQHTCFEAFVKPKGAERYFELNFSPSTAWAAYTFDSYRLGMQPLPGMKAPTIKCHASGDTLTLEATVYLKSLRFDSAVGLCAVIENVQGMNSYWSLTHPRPKPDFHDVFGWTTAFRRFTAEPR